MYALLLAALLTADTPTTLRGTVKDEQGGPLAGALVAVQVGWDQQATAKTTKTDAAGHYALAELPKIEPNSRVQVLALVHGRAAGMRLLETGMLGEDLDFQLAPAKAVEVDILDPAGNPIAGAEVLSMTLIQGGLDRGRSVGELQPAVLREFPLSSNAAGKLRIDVLPADTYFAMEVSAPGFGRQRELWQLEDLQRPLKLRPVGSLAGTLKPPPGKSAEGLRVRVEVRSADNPYFIAWGSATTDAAGSFTVPAIAAGKATVRVESDLARPVRPGPPQEFVVEVGRQATVELELSPVVEVTGTVVDLEGDKPIAGAKVNVSNYTTHQEYQTVTTDEQGVYRASLGAGTIGADAVEVPLPYYLGVLDRVSAKPEAGAAAVKLDPIRVPRGMRREGTVVDEAGQPVAGAWVTAIWREEQATYSTMGSRSAQTDEAGRFTLDAVSSRVEIHLRAETAEQAGTDYVTVGLDSQEPVKLTVSKAGAAVVTGRVLDERGQPLAGASVRIHGGYRRPAGGPRFSREHELEWTLTTDAEGRFATRQPLPRTLPHPGQLKGYQEPGYFTTVSAPGRLQQRLQTVVGAGSPFVVPDIVLKSERNVSGVVVDRSGQPVAGAAVQADGLEEYRTATATTDAAGRFTLKLVHPDARFWFARHADYVFTGAPIPPAGEEARLVLLRQAEASAEPPLVRREGTPEEKLAALRDLLPRVWDKLDPKVGIYGRTGILKAMARHDPQWVAERLPQIASARYQIGVLRTLGQLEDAAAMSAGLRSADERARHYTALAAEMKVPGRARELLSEAVIEARTIIDPTRRLSAQVQVARVLFDIGDKEAAQKLISEQLPEIEKLEAGFWRGYMAETVALFDVEKALALCEGATDEYERDRHPGNIAHVLAARDPARAEAIVKSLTERNQYRYIAPVCYRMATVDLPRAKRIADEALPAHEDPKPYAYAVMAQALADKDPATARELLRRSFESLASDRSGRSDPRWTFGLAMAMTHISETVDPAATREYVWRSIAHYKGTQIQPTTEWDAENKFRVDCQLAVLLARYGLYPEIVSHLVAPLYTTDKLKPQRMREDIFPIAMAMADRAQAAAWLDRYLAAAKGDELRYIPQPWELMAPAVAGDDATFWEALHRHVLHRWWPDVEDF
jgi:protocatechuate 3,4-dioxygenase beta subunit